SAKLANPRLNGPAPMAATSTCSVSRLIINPRELGYQFMPGVRDQVGDLYELVQRGVGIQQSEFAEAALVDCRGGDHGLSALVKALADSVGECMRASDR